MSFCSKCNLWDATSRERDYNHLCLPQPSADNWVASQFAFFCLIKLSACMKQRTMRSERWLPMYCRFCLNKWSYVIKGLESWRVSSKADKVTSPVLAHTGFLMFLVLFGLCPNTKWTGYEICVLQKKYSRQFHTLINEMRSKEPQTRSDPKERLHFSTLINTVGQCFTLFFPHKSKINWMTRQYTFNEKPSFQFQFI